MGVFSPCSFQDNNLTNGLFDFLICREVLWELQPISGKMKAVTVLCSVLDAGVPATKLNQNSIDLLYARLGLPCVLDRRE